MRMRSALHDLYIFDREGVCKGRSGLIKGDAMLAQIVRRLRIIPLKFVICHTTAIP
jgi:outer membrane receptor for ferric coprogen and ferric-rhodotorulic acid